MIRALPNILTLSRIALTPLFLYFLFTSEPYYKIYALIVFVIASLTDTYDGYFARKWKVVSRLGKFTDPLADKVLVWSAFIAYLLLDFIPLWMVILIILRDVFVTGLRMFFLSKKGKSMQTSYFAKVKTTIQLVAIIFVLVYLITQSWSLLEWIAPHVRFVESYRFLGIANTIELLMFITTVLTVFSGIHYAKVNFQVLRNPQ